jgi:hypothetical protein
MLYNLICASFTGLSLDVASQYPVEPRSPIAIELCLSPVVYAGSRSQTIKVVICQVLMLGRDAADIRALCNAVGSGCGSGLG